jgi:3-hydroxypropanoate dehydrogenase
MNLFAGEEKAETATQFALTTSTLQGTYFMLAARALGLDVGAMGGFDTCALDARSSGTARRSGFPRTPRAAAFDEVARCF